MIAESTKTRAHSALAILLGLNLLNFIDRYILAALEPSIRKEFFAPTDPNAMWWTGTLSTAFVLSYTFAAPAFGWLADRFSRWIIVGIAAMVWSLATGASGLAESMVALFIARLFVGIGEGGYGPAAPPIISDLYPVESRARMLAFFFAAIPLGNALGYVLGSLFNIHFGWRSAFWLVALPGLVLGLFCFFRQDSSGEIRPRNSQGMSLEYYLHTVRELLKTRSYVFNVAAQTMMAFALGGMAYWFPGYLNFRKQPAVATAIFGAIVAVAGVTSTLTGGFLADRLRKTYPACYFLIPGIGMLIGCPLVIAMLYTPFPFAWVLMFAALFFIYLNVGPANTATVNVSLPSVRATAFALNIFVIHILGDAISPPLLGLLAGHTNLHIAFLAVSAVMLVSGLIWLSGAKYLAADMAAVENTSSLG